MNLQLITSYILFRIFWHEKQTKRTKMVCLVLFLKTKSRHSFVVSLHLLQFQRQITSCHVTIPMLWKRLLEESRTIDNKRKKTMQKCIFDQNCELKKIQMNFIWPNVWVKFGHLGSQGPKSDQVGFSSTMVSVSTFQPSLNLEFIWMSLYTLHEKTQSRGLFYMKSNAWKYIWVMEKPCRSMASQWYFVRVEIPLW